MSGEANKGELVLFASFDLANSSAFKYQDADWVSVYTEIMRFIMDNTPYSSEWRFWKLNGDELLLYCQRPRNLDLDRVIVASDKLMARAVESIHACFANRDHIRQLSLKTTMWLASVYPFVHGADNIEKDACDFHVQFGNCSDFVGMETDIGFRISKWTPRAKTALSCGLVYYLVKSRSEILGSLRIADYVNLKGVLGGKRYPIIWYLRCLTEGKSILRSFHYDEKHNNKCIGSFLANYHSDPEYGSINDPEDFVNMLDYLGLKGRYDRTF